MTKYLSAKIEEIEVTESSISYEGSITLDPELIKEAGLLEWQAVDVNSKTTGERATTYILKGKKGDCQINGALSHKFKRGELVHINTYGYGWPFMHNGKFIVPPPEIITKQRVKEILSR